MNRVWFCISFAVESCCLFVLWLCDCLSQVSPLRSSEEAMANGVKAKTLASGLPTLIFFFRRLSFLCTSALCHRCDVSRKRPMWCLLLHGCVLSHFFVYIWLEPLVHALKFSCDFFVSVMAWYCLLLCHHMYVWLFYTSRPLFLPGLSSSCSYLCLTAFKQLYRMIGNGLKLWLTWSPTCVTL